MQIAFSTDLRGFGRISTVIAAVVRRTSHPVSIKIYCQGFRPESFSGDGFEVEFLPTEEERSGNFPLHVGSAVFDRMQVIRDATAWERCLILDHDMLSLCDLAPYFAEDFDGNLLMGRLFGPGNTLGLQMANRGGLPKSLQHTAGYPYFYMGPMMNLAAMRREGTWKKLLRIHGILRQEEQLALTAATGGRVKGVGRKWNLVPQWDHLADGPSGPPRSAFGTCGEPATWRKGLPEGLIHWTGPGKPWDYESRVWRADLWASEETSWEALRQGWWEKPLAVEIDPPEAGEVTPLARRGWKVLAVSDPAQGLRKAALPYPDVDWIGPGMAARRRPDWLDAAEMVRFGPASAVLPWLEKASPLPGCVVLRGPVSGRAIDAVRRLGYRRMARVDRQGWPCGGPAPAALDFEDTAGRSRTLPEGQDLYLLRPGEPLEGTVSR